MKKSLVILVVLALAIAGTLVWAMQFLGKTARPVGSIRDVVPDSVVYYVEAENLVETWGAVRDTSALEDLKRSSLWIDQDGPIQEVLATLDDLSSKVEYPLDDTNLMKFLGRRAGFGVAFDPAQQRLAGILATRLDLEALSRDLLAGDMDWRALQEELNSRTEKAEFELVSRPYREYSVTTARKGETIVYWTLLEDVLVVSNGRPLLDAAIDARIDGRGGLSRSAVFTSEVAKLDGTLTAFDWVHLAAIDAERATARTCWKSLQGEELPWMYDGLLDAVKGCPALARAYELPAGDLYQASWRYSRGPGEVFVDQTSPPLESFAADAVLYMEGRRLGSMIRSWEGSALRAHLGDSALARKIDAALDDPQAAMEKALRMAPVPVPGGAPDVGEGSLAFPVRFGWNAVRRGVESLFAGDIALSFENLDLSGDTPAFVAAARLGMDGRFLALIGNQAEEVRSYGRVGDYTLHGTSADAPDAAYWVLAGDLFLIGPDLEAVRKAGHAVVAGEPPGGFVGEALARLGEAHQMRCVMDVRTMFEEALGDDPDFAGPFKPQDLYGARYYAFSVGVDEGFTKLSMRYDYPLAPDASELAKVLTLNPNLGRSRLLDLGPADTMLLFSYNYDAAAWMKAIRSFVVNTIGEPESDLDEALGQADEFLGMSLERELLPALQGELGFVMVRNAESAGQGQPPIPEMLLALGHVDRAPVERALGRVVDVIGEEIEQQASRGRGPSQRLLKEDIAGRMFHSLDLAGQAGPLQPTFGILDDYLLVGSTPQAVRALTTVLDGQAPSWRDQPRIARACAGLPDQYSALTLLDWVGFLQQLDAYVDPLAQTFADVPPPEFPENGDMEEWQRRMKVYEEQKAAAGKESAEDVRAVFDAWRVVESIVSWGGVEGDHAIGAAEILFREGK